MPVAAAYRVPQKKLRILVGLSNRPLLHLMPWDFLSTCLLVCALAPLLYVQ